MDLYFILEGLREIQGNEAVTDAQPHLENDLFSDSPKAYVSILETVAKPIAFVLYNFGYFAREGQVLWISQAYIAPAYRGKVTRLVQRHIEQLAQKNDLKHILFASDKSNEKLSRFWKAKKARDLGEYFRFWVLKKE